jgi:DNA-binding response OmpR family regulator
MNSPDSPEHDYFLTIRGNDRHPFVERSVMPITLSDGTKHFDLGHLATMAHTLCTENGLPMTTPVGLEVRPVMYAFADNRIIVKPNDQAVLADGRQVDFGPRPFSIISLLASRPGELWRTDAILEHVWGEAGPQTAQSMHVAMMKIRTGLGPELKGAIRLNRTRPIGYIARKTLLDN